MVKRFGAWTTVIPGLEALGSVPVVTHGRCEACGRSTKIEPFDWASTTYNELVMLCADCWDVARDLYERLTGKVYGHDEP